MIAVEWLSTAFSMILRALPRPQDSPWAISSNSTCSATTIFNERLKSLILLLVNRF